LAKFALEAHAPRNLESRETQRSICLPDLPRVRTPIDFRDATGKDRNESLAVKQKPPTAILARAIALGLCFFDSASAQSSDE
jgi:hypothetical protein